MSLKDIEPWLNLDSNINFDPKVVETGQGGTITVWSDDAPPKDIDLDEFREELREGTSSISTPDPGKPDTDD